MDRPGRKMAVNKNKNDSARLVLHMGVLEAACETNLQQQCFPAKWNDITLGAALREKKRSSAGSSSCCQELMAG